MYFLYSVMSAVLVDSFLLQAALSGLGAGILEQGVLSLVQRASGAARATGTITHQNGLAFVVNLIVPIAFALYLGNGAMPAFALAVVACGAISVLLGLSRAGMVAFCVMVAVVLVGSFVRRPTLRKARIILITGVLGLIGAVAAGAVVLNRFETAESASAATRWLFNRAAILMAYDHPLGVGVGLHQKAMVTEYAARVGMLGDIKRFPIHNLYFATLAETNVQGLLSLVAVLASIYVTATRLAFQPGYPGDIGLGIVAGLTTAYAQASLEGTLRGGPTEYVFWMVVALLTAVDQLSKRQARAHHIGRFA
jgi:hypothetical protein